MADTRKLFSVSFGFIDMQREASRVGSEDISVQLVHWRGTTKEDFGNKCGQPRQLASKTEMRSQAVCVNIKTSEPVLLVYFTGSKPLNSKALISFPCVA